MPLIVQKYGGSSLKNTRLIHNAAERIKFLKRSEYDVVVVVSAMGRMTDHLIRLAYRTVTKPPQRELDMLMTAGERVSMSLLAMALDEMGIPAISFTGSQSGIITTNEHTNARILEIRPSRIHEELLRGKVVIIAGFQGVSREKEITTLGRGGSDTTAVALAAALKAERCEILTDVDGLFTADPRLVPEARLIEHLSFEDAVEYASLGAKMHARSIEVARRNSVALKILSSVPSNYPGTVISGKKETKGVSMENPIVRGISSTDGFHFFKVQSEFHKIPEVLGLCRVPLSFFSFSEKETRFLCAKDKAAQIKETLESRKFEWEESTNVAVVSAVGEGLLFSYEIISTFLNVLNQLNIQIYLVSSNSISISAAIPGKQLKKAVQLMHDALLNNCVKAAATILSTVTI